MAYSIPTESQFGPAASILTAGVWDTIFWGGVPGTTLRVGDTYYFYYVGADTDGDPNYNVLFRAIGLATSSDGVTWTKDAGNPIITYTTSGGTETEEGASNPVVLYADKVWHMWYGASRATGGDQVDVDIRYRTSADGITWTGDALVYSNAGDEYIPVGAFIDSGVYHLYYVGPLTGGAGNLRHRYGSTPTALDTDELMLSGSWRAARGFQPLDVSTFLITLGTGSAVTLRTIARATPGSISSEVTQHSSDLGSQSLFFDMVGRRWLLIKPNVDGDAFVLRLASANDAGLVVA